MSMACPSCGKPINPGQECYEVKGGGLVHTACAERDGKVAK